MALGEDLLMAAIAPRGGRVRVPDRIGFALRAAELVDLVLAGRIEVEGRRIAVIGQTPIGDRRLAGVLAALESENEAPTVKTWLRGALEDVTMAGEYFSLLQDQGAVRVEQRRNAALTDPRIVVLDTARRAAVLARIDGVAQGRAAPPPDVVLAGLVSACRLDRHLYRGPFGRSARRRLAGAVRSAQIVASVDGMIDPRSVEAAKAVAQALPEDIDRLVAIQYVLNRGHQTGGYTHVHHGHTGGHHDAGGYGGGDHH
ncbi:MAG TPA: GPP34 family phosphoprotein [Actinocrinis sp.]